MLQVKELDVAGKAVFLRTEFNVALDKDYRVIDDSRIKASLPTIQWLLNEGAKVVICSHIGRPWGQRDDSKSLRHIVEPLASLLGRRVEFSPDCIGSERERLQNKLQPSDILLLENVRFYKEENENDESFSKELAEGIEIYVNDAFGNSHRPHASMVGVPRVVPEKAAGILVDREVSVINSFLESAEHPAVAIIGGAKVVGKDGKIHVIRNLVKRMDCIAVVGKIAYFFLKSMGMEVGSTIAADDRKIDAPGADTEGALDSCRSVMELARKEGAEVVLPVDSAVVTSSDDTPSIVEHDKDEFAAAAIAYDVGPKTVGRIVDLVGTAKSVVWNGPIGYVEDERFRSSTLEVARKIRESKARALIGGGDTVTVLSQISFDADNVHICTGGGAMLTMLMGRDLPALLAIETS